MKADALAQFGEGDAALLLEDPQDVPVDPVQVAGSAFGAGRLGAWTGGAVGGQGNLHGWPGC